MHIVEETHYCIVKNVDSLIKRHDEGWRNSNGRIIASCFCHPCRFLPAMEDHRYQSRFQLEWTYFHSGRLHSAFKSQAPLCSQWRECRARGKRDCGLAPLSRKEFEQNLRLIQDFCISYWDYEVWTINGRINRAHNTHEQSSDASFCGTKRYRKDRKAVSGIDIMEWIWPRSMERMMSRLNTCFKDYTDFCLWLIEISGHMSMSQLLVPVLSCCCGKSYRCRLIFDNYHREISKQTGSKLCFEGGRSSKEAMAWLDLSSAAINFHGE